MGNSRGELEELRLFEPVVEGDPGGSDLLVEGQVASIFFSNHLFIHLIKAYTMTSTSYLDQWLYNH